MAKSLFMRLTVKSTYWKYFRTLLVLLSLNSLSGRSTAATPPTIGTTTFDNAFPGLTVLVNAQPSPQTAANVGTLVSTGWNFTATAPTDNVSISAQAGGFTNVASDLYIRLNRQTPGKTLTQASVKSNDGSFFSLGSFYLRIGASAAANIVITGYSAGVAVPQATTTVALANNVWTLITLSSILNTGGTAAFGTVDEFRVTQAGSTTAQIGNFSIDQITIQTPLLPLTLTDFSGHAEGARVQLQWTTASEQNTSTFEIQRGNNGSDLLTVGQVSAAGNSSQTLHYQFMDAPPVSSSTWLYRLKMVDLDGRFTYSPVLNISPQASIHSLSAYPNPFREQLAITMEAPEADKAQLTLRNMNGQQLLRQDLSIQKGANSFPLPAMVRLPAGLYLLNIATSHQQQTIRVLKIE